MILIQHEEVRFYFEVKHFAGISSQYTTKSKILLVIFQLVIHFGLFRISILSIIPAGYMQNNVSKTIMNNGTEWKRFF